MRILFAFAGGTGHVNPMLPVARAAEAAGHTVAVTGRPSALATVAAAGFTTIPTGPPPGGPYPRRPLLPYDAQREEQVIERHYAGSLARDRAARVQALCLDWKPDLLVCDEVDFGGMLAAERLGLPYASVVVLAAGSFVRPELIAEPLAALRAELGLPPDPDLVMLHRHLVLVPVPPPFRDPAYPLPPTAYPVRPLTPLTPRDAELPPWPGRLPAAPTVYFTLGTEFNIESGDLFHRVIAGLRDQRINLLVTVGEQIDPAEFGPQPAQVRIERYLPQTTLLPHCDLVISHAGSGSVVGALAHGLPMLLFPMGADQPHNARRCDALGVGRVLDPVSVTPAQVGTAARAVLDDPAYRAAAGRLRDETAALPDPATAVPLLERLAANRQTA